ncbi:MAG: hypothetical protein AAGD96_06700 [Chloroflexota bacterium]
MYRKSIDPDGAKNRFLRKHGALVAMALVAVSFWHLAWSRYSVRVILTPLLFSLVIGFLLRGLRKSSSKDIWLAGIGLGIGFYTYQLAQPLIILLAVIVFFRFALQWSWPSKIQFRDFSIAIILAILLVIPLILYGLQNPGAFNRRLDDVVVVSVDQDVLTQLQLLWDRGMDVARLFFIEGDYDPTVNLPGRPLLSPLLAVFFVLGLLVAGYKWKNWIYPVLLFWLVFYSLPGVVADQAALAKRTFGALPAVFVLITIGMGTIFSEIDRWMEKPRVRANIKNSVSFLGMGLIIALCSWVTYEDYFVEWAANPNLEGHFMTQQANIGRFIGTLPEDEEVYLSPIWRENAPIILYSDRRSNINDFNGRHCFVAPQKTDDGTTYIMAPNLAGKSIDHVDRFFPTGTWQQEMDLESQTSFSVYQIPANAMAQPQPQVEVDGIWDDKVQLIGYDLEHTEQGGSDTLTVSVYYLTLDQIRFEWTAYVHVRTDEGEIMMAGQKDRQPCEGSYPTTRWIDGQIIRDEFVFPLSADAPAGSYSIFTGFYTWPSLERVPLTEPHAGESELKLAEIQIE